MGKGITSLATYEPVLGSYEKDMLRLQQSDSCTTYKIGKEPKTLDGHLLCALGVIVIIRAPAGRMDAQIQRVVDVHCG